MAKKTAKARKTATRKKVTKAARGKRRTTTKAAKKPRKAAAAKSRVTKVLESTGALNLLRAWSPSRYSTR
jgi:hypothetical protein